ncbi:MAG: protein required for attachment to host cell [Caulobacter sp.]|nr:protein required for attachment to host cell [Caulobacter sp.]
MMIDGRTLVAVVDGRRARLFQEARYGGPLSEHPEWIAEVKAEHARHKGPTGGVHDSHGFASHGTTTQGAHDKSEQGYLAAVASHLDAVMARDAFDHLVIMAPPRALGLLRAALSPGLQRKLACTEPHDRVDAPIAEIEVRLRELRRDKA